jgi:hypothetical protein
VKNSFDLSSKFGRRLIYIPLPDSGAVVTTKLWHYITGPEVAAAMRGVNWVSGAVCGGERV